MIHADASGARRKLNSIKEALSFAPYALGEVATETIGAVSDNAVTRLAGRNDQIGFDLPQFLDNIREPGPLEVRGADGNISILDTTRMGTAEDFERIAGQFPSLWHEGQGAVRIWQQAVYDRPAVRDAVATGRQSVWNPTTPQWFLLEDGYNGSDAYPPVPPAHFIDSAKSGILGIMGSVMGRLFRGIQR